MNVWIVTRFRFEREDPTGPITGRSDEVLRLPGEMAPDEVAVIVEHEYARLYQRGFTETSVVEERATAFADEIWVGHEPRFRARLVKKED